MLKDGLFPLCGASCNPSNLEAASLHYLCETPACNKQFLSLDLLSWGNPLAAPWADLCVSSWSSPHPRDTGSSIRYWWFGFRIWYNRVFLPGRQAFHQESFPSWLLIKSFGEEERVFHLSEVANRHYFLWYGQRCAVRSKELSDSHYCSHQCIIWGLGLFHTMYFSNSK